MPQNCSVSHILQNIIFVFSRTNTFIQVWKYSRMSKWWHSFHVWVNYPFKISFPPDFNAFWTFPLTGLQGTWAVPRVLRSQFPSWWSLCVRWRWRSPPRTTVDPWTNTRSRERRPRTGPGDTRLPSVLRERKITLVSWREWSGLHIKCLRSDSCLRGSRAAVSSSLYSTSQQPFVPSACAPYGWRWPPWSAGPWRWGWWPEEQVRARPGKPTTGFLQTEEQTNHDLDSSAI